MKVLTVYPRFPEETYWNALRSVKLFLRRRGDMPPLGLLAVASHPPADFEVRLVDRNVTEETDADWEWAAVIFLSAMLAQRGDYARCVGKAKAHGKPFAVGGPLTHAMPEAQVEDGGPATGRRSLRLEPDRGHGHSPVELQRASPRPARVAQRPL